MIRAGLQSDINAIVAMSSEFWGHTIYDVPCIDSDVTLMANACIEQKLMSVLEVGGAVVGFACAVAGPLLANHSVKTATEIAWWVNPDHRSGRNGIGLLRHIERLAKEAGVRYFNMAYMESSMPEEIKSIYERLGYSRLEVIYCKELS